MHRETFEKEVQKLLAGMDKQNEQEPKTETPDGIQDIYVLVVREQEEEGVPAPVVDSIPVKHKRDYWACIPVCVFLLVIFSTLAFQLYCLFYPPIATVTIIPESQQVTLSSTLQLGRILSPLKLSQSQTTPTTGKGHQDAKAATGYLTFFNGQFQSITIAAGTILTGASNIQIVTDQDATIPAGNPPNYGQVSVSAHALVSGTRGNIPAYDINQACCATSVLAKNIQSFYGGQDERNFSTVSAQDINKTSTPLKTAVAKSVAGAFQGQLKQGEAILLPPCSPSVTSDHQPGDEAIRVKVTVSETCSAVAYNSQEVAEKATALLSTQAQQKLGTGYSFIGTVQVSVKQATVTGAAKPLVFLSVHAQGLLVYALSLKAQEQIKHMIVGESTQEALQNLQAVPGIKHASIRFNGFGDDTRLPKQNSSIHIAIVVV